MEKKREQKSNASSRSMRVRELWGARRASDVPIKRKKALSILR